MAFGAASQQPAPRGTRAIPFVKTKETEQAGLPGGSKPTQPGEFMSISAMPAYQGRCFEELRMEDYQVRHQPAWIGISGIVWTRKLFAIA